MHLTEVLALRPVPAAAVLLALTRRCPLSCAHCSTRSGLGSEEHPEEPFRRLVGTFGADDRPELIVMSGGEPLLRPRLVLELAERARRVGCRSYVLSGLFFARGRRIPSPIRHAIDEVDHFAASLDAFHEREVPRAAVLRVLGELLERGKDVSLQVVGLGADDPYLAEVTADVRRTFDDRVPMLVGGVGAVGRAASWLARVAPAARTRPVPEPCTLAAWPLVSFDGTIVACCNQRVVDGPAPAHLRLGHAARDEWSTIRERYLSSPVLRAIRAYGPEYLADRLGSGRGTCDGYCSTCHKLSDDPELEHSAGELDRPPLRVLEHQVVALQREAGAVAYARRFGVARYAELVTLGAPESERETTSAV